MKALSAIAIGVLLVSATAGAQTITRDDLRKTVVHMSELAKQQDAVLADTQKQLSAANVALLNAKQQIDAANQRLLEVNASLEKLRQWGVDQQLRADKAEYSLTVEKAAHQATLDRYHRLKLIAALVVGVLALLASLQLGPLLPLAGPYGALVPVAAGLGGFSLIWLLL